MRVRPLSFVLGLLVLAGAGCDFCIPAGADNPPPSRYLMSLDVQVASDGSAFELRRVPALTEDDPFPGYADPPDRTDVHVGPEGRRVLVGRTLYQVPSTETSLVETPEDNGTPLPDSLNSCTFAHQQPTLVCGVVAPDTLVHPETGRRLPVQAARSRLAVVSDSGARYDPLRTARAEFTGSFDYRSTTYTAPDLSLDDQRIAVLRRVEEHHLVRDSSGAIVDDVVQVVERTLVVFDRSRPEAPRRSIALPGGVSALPRVALAPNGKRVAVEIDEGIRYASTGDGPVQKVAGRNPQFTGAGEHLLATTGSHEMTIYDLSTGAAQSEREARAYASHPRTDRVYYVSGTTLKTVDASSGDTTVAGDLKPRLVQNIDDDPTGMTVSYRLRIEHLASPLDTRRLMPLGILERQLHEKSSC